jgi:hypothetical protein
MSEQPTPQISIVEIPAPDSNEMVKFIAARMDELFDGLAALFPFTTGDIMSACLCHMVEKGKVGRDGDMEALKGDILQSVEVAIAHYSRPDMEKRH